MGITSGNTLVLVPLFQLIFRKEFGSDWKRYLNILIEKSNKTCKHLVCKNVGNDADVFIQNSSFLFCASLIDLLRKLSSGSKRVKKPLMS